VIERIHIEQLKVRAHVGVPADERSQPQRLTLNVTFWPRITPQRDELEDTINYSGVAKMVREVVRRRRYKLIETVAKEVAGELLRQFALGKVVVEVRKFVLADADYVSVTAVRESERV
jgi:7,8-dihydroneopterin aldolase/epimerase/oxygenase